MEKSSSYIWTYIYIYIYIERERERDNYIDICVWIQISYHIVGISWNVMAIWRVLFQNALNTIPKKEIPMSMQVRTLSFGKMCLCIHIYIYPYLILALFESTIDKVGFALDNPVFGIALNALRKRAFLIYIYIYIYDFVYIYTHIYLWIHTSHCRNYLECDGSVYTYIYN